MASAVLRQRAAQRGWSAWLQVDSAGTYDGHAGEPADRRAVSLATARGYPDILTERARGVTDADFVAFDLILAMDWFNLARLMNRCPPEHQHKLARFLDFAGCPTAGDGGDVPDPYHEPASAFEAVLGLCEQGAEGVLDRLAAHAPGRRRPGIGRRL